MSNINTHDSLLAHYYDLEYRDFTDDIDFYVQFAIALDPKRKLPVLELGCGTGRVTLALAKAGFRVVCVDLSQAMLDVCMAQAGEQGVSSLVTAIRADMCDLEGVPVAQYNMAFCALNTFAYLQSTTEQLAMLNAVREKLVQHGILLLDLTPPWPGFLPPSDGELIHQGTYPDSNGGILHKLVTGRADAATQTHNITLIYDREAADGTLTRTSHSMSLRWTGRYEMGLLLQQAGYRVENLYGGYELEDFSDSSDRMIFVART